jgi:gliding motility-associated-like protein
VSADGCISRNTVKVTVNALPELITGDIEVCYGSKAEPVASSSDAVSLTWYDDANCTNVIAQAASFETAILTADTTFYVEAVSVDGCISRDNVKVTVNPLPELITGDIEVCAGSTATLTASSADAVSFTWYADANCTNVIVHEASFETAILTADTTFYVEAVSADGCVTRNTVKVTVNPLPELITGDIEVCYGSKAVPAASSSDAVSLTWYSDANYVNTITSADSFETMPLTADTAFYVKTVSIKGCISRKAVDVAINALPELLINDHEPVCSGTSVRLNASGSDAVSPAWYGDSAYTNLIGQGASYQTGALTASSTFYVESTSDKGCKTRASAEVPVVLPPAVIAMDDYRLCYGEEVTLNVLQSDGAVSWNADPLTVSPVSTRQYVVTASRFPCPDAKDSVTITVGDSLYISTPDLPIYKNHTDYSHQLASNAESPVFTLIAGSLPLGLFLNASGQLSGTDLPNEDISVSVFTVQVEDIHGCTAEKEYTLEKDLFVPKVFTPDGDGINDFFMRGYELIIFDRLGIIIFKGDDGWDGTYNGKPAPQDIYFYKLYYKNKNGEIAVKDGYIGLERTKYM